MESILKFLSMQMWSAWECKMSEAVTEAKEKSKEKRAGTGLQCSSRKRMACTKSLTVRAVQWKGDLNQQIHALWNSSVTK